jgi:hypothetical protein
MHVVASNATAAGTTANPRIENAACHTLTIVWVPLSLTLRTGAVLATIKKIVAAMVSAE